MQTEGRNAVLELLKSGATIEKIMLEREPQGSLNKIFAQARSAGVRVQFVDRRTLDKHSVTGRHQGCIAFSTDYKYFDLEDIISSARPGSGFVIVCDGIEDVHNLGSIIRVAECAGADGVVIPSHNCASVTESVVRISAGAANHIRVARVNSLGNAVKKLKDAGFWLYALEADGSDIYSADLSGNVALVVGGEDSGVKKLLRSECDFTLSIPLRGKVNSLNASVALGIAAYEVVKTRL